jgi:hypothetical protein
LSTLCWLLTLALRFVDVVWGLPTIAMMFAFAPALSAAGIHPIILCFLSGVIQCFTILQYMSPFAIMSGNILEHRGWTERHMVIYGLGYLLCVALAVLPAIWYWRLLGIALITLRQRYNFLAYSPITLTSTRFFLRPSNSDFINTLLYFSSKV